VIAAFEHEFVYTGIEDQPGHAYSLNAFRRQGAFGESFIAALRAAGVTADSLLAENGPRQEKGRPWSRGSRHCFCRSWLNL
jgi:glutamine synthetase